MIQNARWDEKIKMEEAIPKVFQNGSAFDLSQKMSTKFSKEP